MRRFDRLQLVDGDPWSIKYGIEAVVGMQAFLDGQAPDNRLEVVEEQKIHIENGFQVLFMEHLDAEHPFNPEEMLRVGVNAAVKWGDAWHRHERRQELAWIDPYREGMLLALCLGDEKAIQSLASYPDMDVRLDEFGYKREEALYYILLASLIRGRDLDSENVKGWVAAIERGRCRRAKLLLQAALDLFRDQADAFRKSFTTYMKHFRKSEFDRQVFIYCMSMDGSLLWNLAVRRGLELELLDLELMDLIITPASLHLGESRSEDHAQPIAPGASAPCEAQGADENPSGESFSEQIRRRDERKAKLLLQEAQEAAEDGDVARARELLAEAMALTALWGTLTADAMEQHGISREIGDRRDQGG